MRVVLDTNVLVSAMLVEASVPSRCVEHVTSGYCSLLLDERIAAEYRAVLRRQAFGLDLTAVEDVLSILERYAEWVHADPLAIRLPDASDLPFLEVAVAGGADAIITGNVAHFRVPGGRLAIDIVTPRQFLDRLGGRR